jgi:hypothetical protein
MTSQTWTLKIETMEGTQRTIKVKAPTLDGAIRYANKEWVRIGNVLAAWDSKKVRWL